MSAVSGIKKVKKVMTKKTSVGGAEITTETTTITSSSSQEINEYGGPERFDTFLIVDWRNDGL